MANQGITPGPSAKVAQPRAQYGCRIAGISSQTSIKQPSESTPSAVCTDKARAVDRLEVWETLKKQMAPLYKKERKKEE